MKTWYDMANGKLLIHGEIGAFGVTGKDFIDALRQMPPCEELEIEVSSPGGSVIDGLMIYDALREYPAKKKCSVIGWAASMGSVVAMAADSISMSSNSFLMIHNPWMQSMGDAEQLRKDADILDKMKAKIIGAYMRHAKIKQDELEKMLDDETWLTAQEAMDIGLCHEVTGELAMAAKYDATKFKSMPEKAKGWTMDGTPKTDVITNDASAQSTEDKAVDDVDTVPKGEFDIVARELETVKLQHTEVLGNFESARNEYRLTQEKLNAEIKAKDKAIEDKTHECKGLKSSLDKAHNELADLRERLTRLTAGGMNFSSDEVGGWKDALSKCNGDYVRARKEYAALFASYMALYNKPKSKI